MPITPQIEQWLKEAGYDYHCFISYPRVDGHPINECAVRVKEAILQELKLSCHEPRVFLDVDMPSGTKWEMKMKRALCGSLVMIAICAGIYYHPAHKWCGLEWAAMDSLNQTRLPGHDLETIIPLMIRVETPIPAAVSRIQFIDISRATLLGRNYYRTKEFRMHIKRVTGHIEKVAEAVALIGARTDCNHFEFPSESAFTDWYPADQAFPFHGKS